MSGLAAIRRFDGAPILPTVLEQMLSRLVHRAIDGQSAWFEGDGTVALGHLHFWTTPEEVDERQPHVHGRLAVVLDGRIDNREELAAALGLTRRRLSALTDAALIALAFKRWDKEFMSRVIGPLAIVLWDGGSCRLLCWRDALGRRSLFYRLTPSAIFLASEPGAIANGRPSSADLDRVFLAHFYSLRHAEGRTVYEAVREVRAGHMLEISDGELVERRYWSPPASLLQYRTRSEYFEHFTELLDRAVARRMRSAPPPAVLMSGGLDSTSVTALAARRLESAAETRRLRVYSYIFDKFADLDERAWMDPMVEMYNLDQVTVLGDYAWPLSDIGSWRWDASGPLTDIFGALNERLYAASREDQLRVLLTGTAADTVLRHADRSWLGDLLVDGYYLEAARRLVRHLRTIGIRPVLHSDSVRRAVARLVRHRSRGEQPACWLLPSAADMVVPRAGVEGIDGELRQGIDARAMLDALDLSRGFGAGRFEHFAMVELRDPFADRDLVEFTLTIPAYLMYNCGEPKHLLRMALGPFLPVVLLERLMRSDIGPLFKYGFEEAGRKDALSLLARPDAVWTEFARREALAAFQDGRFEECETNALVWSTVSMEWWLDRLEHSVIEDS